MCFQLIIQYIFVPLCMPENIIMIKQSKKEILIRDNNLQVNILNLYSIFE